MRNKIFGGIGILWGGAILLSSFSRGLPTGGGANATGAMTGLIFGAVMLVAGLFYIRK